MLAVLGPPARHNDNVVIGCGPWVKAVIYPPDPTREDRNPFCTLYISINFSSIVPLPLTKDEVEHPPWRLAKDINFSDAHITLGRWTLRPQPTHRALKTEEATHIYAGKKIQSIIARVTPQTRVLMCLEYFKSYDGGLLHVWNITREVEYRERVVAGIISAETWLRQLAGTFSLLDPDGLPRSMIGDWGTNWHLSLYGPVAH